MQQGVFCINHSFDLILAEDDRQAPWHFRITKLTRRIVSLQNADKKEPHTGCAHLDSARRQLAIRQKGILHHVNSQCEHGTKELFLGSR